MTEPIRVLQIFGSLNIGGAESRMMDVFRHINTNQVQFDFLTMETDKQYFDEEISRLGGRIFKIVSPRESSIYSNLTNIINIMKENGPYDAVHSHTSHHSGLVMLAAKLAGIPIRVTHARTTGTKQLGLLTKAMIVLGRLFIKMFATHRLAISNESAIYLYGKTYVDKGKTTVLPNAIDTSKYFMELPEAVDRLKSKYSLESRGPILGNVGRFESMKNQSFLVKVMSEFIKIKPNSLLILIGDGPKKKEIEKMVEKYKLKDNIIFLGIRNDVNIWMKLFDLVIIPSLYEGLSGVAIEAQAAGTPCILSKGVPREVDLGLGITKFVSLDESMDTWLEEISKNLYMKVHDISFIERRFTESGYTLSEEIGKLLSIYKNNKEDKLN
jgi:glycosyltransferase EpsF